MILKIYPLLNLRSKRALTRIKKKWGHSYDYAPKQILLNRLSEQLGLSKEEVLKQLLEERKFILENNQYF